MSTFAHLNDMLHDELHRELRRRGVHDVFLELSRQQYPDNIANDDNSNTQGALPTKPEDIKYAELATEATNADTVP